MNYKWHFSNSQRLLYNGWRTKNQYGLIIYLNYSTIYILNTVILKINFIMVKFPSILHFLYSGHVDFPCYPYSLYKVKYPLMLIRIRSRGMRLMVSGKKITLAQEKNINARKKQPILVPLYKKHFLLIPLYF